MRLSYAARLAFDRTTANWRQSLVGIICMALGWLVLSSFLLLVLNLKDADEEVRGELQMQVYLNDDLTSLQIHSLFQSLKGLAGVEQMEYKSRREALSQMENLLGQETMKGLNPDALPASFLLHLTKGNRSSERASQLAVHVRNMDGVEDVEYGEAWLRKADRSAHTVFLGITIFGIMVALALAAMVAGFTRSAARSQKDMVCAMNLLGAGRADTAVFLIMQGLLLGGAGALTGMLCLWTAHWFLADVLWAQKFLPGPLILGLTAAGTILGALGSIPWSGRNPVPET